MYLLFFTDLCVFCVSPGWCRTNLGRSSRIPWYVYPVLLVVMGAFSRSAEEGADSIVFYCILYSESSKVMDMRVHLVDSILNIRYGTEAGRERARLVKHLGRVLARRAWTREQDMVSGALPGSWSHQWRDGQVKQILAGN